jgi:hypothetical protein
MGAKPEAPGEDTFSVYLSAKGRADQAVLASGRSPTLGSAHAWLEACAAVRRCVSRTEFLIWGSGSPGAIGKHCVRDQQWPRAAQGHHRPNLRVRLRDRTMPDVRQGCRCTGRCGLHRFRHWSAEGRWQTPEPTRKAALQ